MLRPFSFQNTLPNTPEGQNWRTLDEATKTIVKTDLVVTGAIGAVTCPQAYFTLYGPIVFYDLQLSIPNGDQIIVTTYITMPFEPLFNNSVFLAPHAGQVFNNLTKTFIGFAYFATAANNRRLSFGAGYTNSSGATETITVQGWYYRN